MPGTAQGKTGAALAGATVLLAARRESQLEQLCDELTQQGASAAICPTDTTNRNDVEQLIATTLDRFGRIDLLVYATGTNIPDRALDVLAPDPWGLWLAAKPAGA